MKEKLGRVWTVANTNLITGIGTIILTSCFAKSYREKELEKLKKDLDISQQELPTSNLRGEELNSKLATLTVTHLKLSAEYALLTNSVADCRFNFSNSWCFWHQLLEKHDSEIDSKHAASNQH